MVSLDDVEKNRAFAESLEAQLILLSDPDRESARAYGVVGLLRPFPRRWTFYIDADGVIVHIDKDVTPSTAGPQIAESLERLAFPRRSAVGSE
jgi:peroxiredoxin Q/BCP